MQKNYVFFLIFTLFTFVFFHIIFLHYTLIQNISEINKQKNIVSRVIFRFVFCVDPN